MKAPTDKEIETSVANMLRFGVSLAGVVVLAGAVLLLRHPGTPIPSYTQFHPAGRSLSTVKGILGGAFHLDAQAIIQVGLLLLIATPVARVVFCVAGFARQRDRLYTVVSATVLAILFYSLTRGAQ